jgi:hypothetical protein
MISMLQEREPVGYYEYHHGSGKHVLMKDDMYYDDPNRPRYSVKCCLCHCIDVIIFILIVSFLSFAFWICYYLYKNYSDGGR